MTSLLEWIGHAPAWVSNIASALGFAGGVYAWFVSRRDKSLEHRRALDNEWFRVLVFEQVLPPLITFLNEQRAVFGAIAADPARRNVPAQYDSALQAFKAAKVGLQRTVLAVQVISPPKYDDLIGVLDEMDDAVTVHCAANSGYPVEGHRNVRQFSDLERRLSRLTVELFSSLRELHARMQDHPSVWRRFRDWL